ncbi:LysR family transcriptional regulator [Rhodococcus pyridinivorans]|uniref:LysR family transcriptional regulator n=1 Tax=Rhodococcus pyridinivorans TaxID=103816 RepID=UPI003F4DA1FA
MLIESPAMDLIRHLRFFVTVAEEGHFGRAAAVLDMTQPPLSQGLRKLEQHLGSELVHRTRQGAVLTPAGAELLPRARLLVDDADRFLAEAGRVARARGLLHWGATRVLPDRLVTLCVTVLSRRGEATVATRSASTVELVDAVRSGMCDLAVVEHPALTEGLEAGPVVKLRRWLVVPADHRSARRYPLRDVDLTARLGARRGLADPVLPVVDAAIGEAARIAVTELRAPLPCDSAGASSESA